MVSELLRSWCFVVAASCSSRRSCTGDGPGERLYEDLDSFGIFFFPTSARDINFLSASGLDAPNFPGAEARDFFPSEMMEVAEDLEGVGEAARPDLRELVLPTCKDDFTCGGSISRDIL